MEFVVRTGRQLQKDASFQFQVQSVCLLVSLLFVACSFAVGPWWQLTLNEWELNIGLWSFCSEYSDFSTCNPFSDQELTSDIILIRVCMAFSLLLYVPTCIFFGLRFRQLRAAAGTTGDNKTESPAGGPNKQEYADEFEEDTWFMARLVLLTLTALFILISIAHALNCNPKYMIGQSNMDAGISHSANAAIVGLLLQLIATCRHIYAAFV